MHFLAREHSICPLCESHSVVEIGGTKSRKVKYNHNEAEALMLQGRYFEVARMCINSGLSDKDSNVLMSWMLLSGKLGQMRNRLADEKEGYGAEYSGIAGECTKNVAPFFVRALEHLKVAEKNGVCHCSRRHFSCDCMDGGTLYSSHKGYDNDCLYNYSMEVVG